jgi:hypothetical protein
MGSGQINPSRSSHRIICSYIRKVKKKKEEEEGECVICADLEIRLRAKERIIPFAYICIKVTRMRYKNE